MNDTFETYINKKPEEHRWLKELTACGMTVGGFCVMAWIFLNILKGILPILVFLALAAVSIWEVVLIFKIRGDFLSSHPFWKIIITLITLAILFFLPNFHAISQIFSCNFRCSETGFSDYIWSIILPTSIVLLVFFLSAKQKSLGMNYLSFYLLFFAALGTLILTICSLIFPQILPGFFIYALFPIGLAFGLAGYYILDVSDQFHEWRAVSHLDKFIAYVVMLLGSVLGAVVAIFILILPGIASSVGQGMND
jgi:hypothetical protein